MDRAYLEQPVRPMLLRLCAPVALAMVSTFLFQVVDTAFVAQLGGAPLAALGFAAPVYMLLVGLFMGMAVGVSALVGAALGRDARDEAQGLTTTAVLLMTSASAAVGVAGVVWGPILFGGLGADPEILPLVTTYMDVLFVGAPLLTGALAADAAIRAAGDVKRTAAVMMLAGVVNVVLDYLFIFGAGPIPAWGLKGAAWATVGSWAFAALGMAGLLAHHRLLTHRGIGRGTGRLLAFSAPAVLTQVLAPAGAVLITWLAARSGPELVAAIGVATRLEMLALVGITSLSVVLVPVVAQNFGANRPDRVDEIVAVSGRLTVYWGIGAAVVLIAAAGPIASIFGDDPAIRSFTRLYFLIVAPSYAGLGLLSITASVFNGVQVPNDALRVLALKLLMFTAPLAVLGSLLGPWGLFAGLGVSHLLGAWVARRRLARTLAAAGSPLTERAIFGEYRGDLLALVKG